MKNRLHKYNAAVWVKWLRQNRLISKEERDRIAENARRQIREEDQDKRDC